MTANIIVPERYMNSFVDLKNATKRLLYFDYSNNFKIVGQTPIWPHEIEVKYIRECL